MERLAGELRERGHRVVVVAPSDSRELVRDGRARVKAMKDGDADALFDGEVLAVGQSLPFRRGGSVSLPLDVSRTLEDLLENAALDVVHVHEPFAPSAASAALRHSRGAERGHVPLAHRAVRVDPGGAAAGGAAVRPPGRAQRQLRRHPRPGRALLPRQLRRDPAGGRPAGAPAATAARRTSCSRCARSAGRCGSSCARCGGWRPTTTGAPRSGSPTRPALASPPALSRRLRDRVRFAGPADGDEASHLAGADVVVAASAGTAPAPQLVLRALGAGRRAGGVAAAALRGVAGRRRAGAACSSPATR